jgi:hypothetical protein
MRGFFGCGIHDEAVNAFAQNDGLVRSSAGDGLMLIHSYDGGSMLIHRAMVRFEFIGCG